MNTQNAGAYSSNKLIPGVNSQFKNNRGSVVSRISAQSTMKDGEISGYVGGPNTSPNRKSFTSAFKGSSAAKNVKRQSSPSRSKKSSREIEHQI